nr:unnamed protein product [Digitaria exilis]
MASTREEVGAGPMAPADGLHVLADLLEETTLSHDATVRRAAEQKLSESIAWPDYASGLLSIISSQSPKFDKARLAASVHFKDLLRLRWPKPSPTADHRPLPSFESILPSIVSSLGAALAVADLDRIISLLVAAGSLFSRFRDCSGDQNDDDDLHYCVVEFAATLMRVTEFAFQRLQGATAVANPLELSPLFKCLLNCCQLFKSLNSIRLHAQFHSEIPNWTKVFHFLLNTMYLPSVEADGAPDLLCAAVFSKGAQHVLLASPETMGQICDNVIMPNLRLRDEDEKLFISNSIGFIGRDSEGSSADTLRWAAFCLLHGILTNYGEQVAPLVSAHIQKVAAYAADPVNNWKEKDAAIYLVIALMQKPGATAGWTPMVNVGDFFASVVVPELQAYDWQSVPILKATVLRFLNEFRDQIPKATVLSLLPSVVRFLTHESNVVRSYAAVFIESQLIIMDEVLVNTATRSDCFAAVDPFAPPIIQNLSTALSFCDSYENPYLMKCLMRVLKVANIDDNNVVCAINNRLVAILEDMCNKPKNSEFNNYLFEALTAGIGRLDGPATYRLLGNGYYACSGLQDLGWSFSGDANVDDPQRKLICRWHGVSPLAVWKKSLLDDGPMAGPDVHIRSRQGG